MPSIVLTPEQEKTRQNIYWTSGLKGAAIGLGLGAVATVFTLRRSPEFRSLSRPLQSILAVSSTTAGFLFASDSAVTHYENRELGYTDETMLQSLMHKRQDETNMSAFDRSLHYLNQNRWTFIGLSWAVSMAGALGYSFSNKYLTTQQKVVQARMYAQAVTIAVLMASAGISIYVGEDEKNKKEAPDPQLRAVLELPYTDAKKPDMAKSS
ncbi:hypothetical protein G6F70_007688 [Rhizopus microsporus]|uniref:HIG1 domain-containing protein n=2 Tax=Rhizopus TaxID=4842 RepID=A0A367JS70_RHIAZ|nr:hypothetical protein G6F71_007705 [Rhizopus microsporus]RCH92541.1 hypothetical protein CU097_006640 [Rhizopus azygosporus]KAG1196129.1 hypothetical protein G6F70_007688 [Rhizopus microsporus]KAG1207593.1 hypothetical protein G6F69_007920 [Rhizopus microsporus]KAG1228938.1 hypothetical protein G6F67_007499 [Rhizopus microsporus]